jgi:CheY-like chemotaxis protein
VANERLLLVDDDPRVLSSVGRRLAFEGFLVDLAADGAEALQLAAARSPDLVILDVMLPGMSGLDVARRLRQGTPVPILMLTARDAVTDKVAGFESGADDYLVKPFAFEELLARIGALLRRSRPSQPERLTFADLELDVATRGSPAAASRSSSPRVASRCSSTSCATRARCSPGNRSSAPSGGAISWVRRTSSTSISATFVSGWNRMGGVG